MAPLLLIRQIQTAVILFFLLTVTCPSAAAGIIKIATYNTNNLFDAVDDGTEYPDYDPGGPYGWNQAMAEVKAANIARVLTGLEADIVCLQEVESRRALDLLLAKLEQNGRIYPFSAIADKSETTVTCALVSKLPIIETREVSPGKALRSILQVTVRSGRHPLVIFVNHWKSKQGPESRRIISARALKTALDSLPPGTDYLLTGDFNTNHNEFMTFRNIRRLNDTNGLTGINHVLGTTVKNRMVTEKEIKNPTRKGKHYNLWLELPARRRWSYNFFGRKNSLDHIILPPSLYDDRGFSYIDNSFDRFVPGFLFDRRGAVFRWQQADKGRGRHLGRGYSDHLPIFALFRTEVRPCPPLHQIKRYSR